MTWAIATATPGYVYDVQVDRPGPGGCVNWRSGVTARTGVYTASVAGSYRFRARLRKPPPAGGASDWSPVKVFSIS